MAQVFGKDYSKEELMRLIGGISQVAGMKKYELLDGKGRGVRAVDIWTGTGFCFTVILDRGMDISQASHCGKSLCWRSSIGEVHPHFFEPEGMGWLRSFLGGLLTTCGLTYCGAPCEDEGEKLGLHGRVSHTPAEEVSIEKKWEGDDYELSVSGLLRESVVFGENIVLTRKIRTRLGESRLWIYDLVENEGYERTPFMLLYHINGGFPVVSEKSRLISPTLEAVPRDEEAEKGKEDYDRFTSPIPGFKEKCYYHKMKEDEAGLVHCALINENLQGDGFGFYVKYRKEQLPRFIEWKMTGEGTYVVGMEPANCLVEGRDKLREKGILEFLEPGEKKEFELEIGVLSGKEAIDRFKAEVKAI